MSAALQAVKHFRVCELTPLLRDKTMTKAALTTASEPTKIPNPFLPHKSPETGRWHPPKYSLRRQADLINSASASGTLHLLPPGPKLSTKQLAAAVANVTASPVASSSASTLATTESEEVVKGEAATETESWWSRAVVWEGEVKEKEVKGADIGARLYASKKRMFKGHKHERMRPKRDAQIAEAMKYMDHNIKQFRTVSACYLSCVLVHACWQVHC